MKRTRSADEEGGERMVKAPRIDPVRLPDEIVLAIVDEAVDSPVDTMAICQLSQWWATQRGRLLLLAYDKMYPTWRFPRMAPLIRGLCVSGHPWLPLERRAGRAHHLMSLLLRVTFTSVWSFTQLDDDDDDARRINDMILGRGPPEGVLLTQAEIADPDAITWAQNKGDSGIHWTIYGNPFATGTWVPTCRIKSFDPNVLWETRPTNELFWFDVTPLTYTTVWEMDLSALVRLAYPHINETEDELKTRDAVTFA
jgi:hypothetical protein